MLEEYHSVLLNEEPSAIDCMLKLLEQNDMSFIHLALWVIAQFSNGSKRRERGKGAVDCYFEISLALHDLML